MTRTDHLLVILAEEAGEVIYNVTKALRFGLDDIKPGGQKGEENRILIAKELAHLTATYEMLIAEKVLPMMQYRDLKQKKENVEKYFKYSESVDRLSKAEGEGETKP